MGWSYEGGLNPSPPDMTYRITAFAVALLLNGFTQAASLTWSQQWLHSQNNGLGGGENILHDISVYDGSAGYAGSDASGAATSGTFGDGTVTAYRFFREGAAGDVIETYAQSGGLISDISTSDADGFGNDNNSDVWITTDPMGFTSDADFGVAANPGSNSMIGGGLLDATGSIDISGLASGNVYFLYGGYRTRFHIDVTMSGGGNPDITYADLNPDTANNWEHYVLDFAFVNDLGYDTITFDFDSTDTNFQQNMRFTGIVVDGVAIPEPSALLLGSLGGLLLLRRRV